MSAGMVCKGQDFGPLTPCANCRHRAQDHGIMGECYRLDLRTKTGWCKCELFTTAYPIIEQAKSDA